MTPEKYATSVEELTVGQSYFFFLQMTDFDRACLRLVVLDAYDSLEHEVELRSKLGDKFFDRNQAEIISNQHELLARAPKTGLDVSPTPQHPPSSASGHQSSVPAVQSKNCIIS